MPARHENLIAWQRADDLFISVHLLTQAHFPHEERFGLTSQIRRAAYSVPANIVEGFSRLHKRERLQFLQIAWSSLQEVGYCLHAARRLGFLDVAAYDEYGTAMRRVAAPLAGLIKSQRLGGSAGIHTEGGNWPAFSPSLPFLPSPPFSPS